MNIFHDIWVLMEDHKLQVFCAVIEYASFSRAAEARFLTQSAISHLIKGLERDAGTPLVYRHARAVKPTPAGAVYYRHAKKILSGYKRLTEDIHELLHIVKGPLQIGADAISALYLLPQLLYQFRLAYNDVIIHVSVKAPEMIFQQLYNGEIDFAITQETLPDKVGFEEILAEDEMVLIGSENHPLVGKQQLLPEELVSQPFIYVGSTGEYSAFTDSFFHNIGIDPKSLNMVMTTESQSLAIKMVKYGIGFSVVSKWAVFRDIREATVVILKASDQKFLRKFIMIRLEKIPLTAVARAFLQFTQNYSFFVPF
jgi:DNA-binding transcriptional LysR family regulator